MPEEMIRWKRLCRENDLLREAMRILLACTHGDEDACGCRATAARLGGGTPTNG